MIDENDAELRQNLDLLEEFRDRFQVKAATYQQRIARYYNFRVNHRKFAQGDLVLKEILPKKMVVGTN